MSANLIVRVNTSSNDQSYAGAPGYYVDINVDNDYLIFTNGSDSVKDGEALPSQSQLTQAGTIIDTVDIIVGKYILADISDSELKEIELAGNQNTRYVFCFSFDDETASEPILEIWDDEDLDTVALYSLGEGTPVDSWWKGVVTTDGLPGADWAGIALAGSMDNHFLWLNNENGALSGAKDLYCNLKVVVPANFAYSAVEQPILAVKYTSV